MIALKTPRRNNNRVVLVVHIDTHGDKNNLNRIWIRNTIKVTSRFWQNYAHIWSHTVLLGRSSFNLSISFLNILPSVHSMKSNKITTLLKVEKQANYDSHLKSNIMVGVIGQSNWAWTLLLQFNCAGKKIKRKKAPR